MDAPDPREGTGEGQQAPRRSSKRAQSTLTGVLLERKGQEVDPNAGIKPW